MKAPLKVLIFTTTIAISLILIVFYRYNIIGNSKLEPQTTGTKAYIAETMEKQTASSNSPAQIQSQTAISSVNLEELKNGKKLFEEKTCVLCHGPDGKADTPTGQAMKASNLTTGVFKNNIKHIDSTEYILNVIENGIPGTAMVSFKNQIPNEKDRKDLAKFVNSLSNKK